MGNNITALLGRGARAIAGGALLGAIASGCGPSEIAPEQFQADAVTIACSRAFDCCDGSELVDEFARFGETPETMAECTEILRQRFTGQGIAGSVAAERAAYDQSAARACLDTIGATTCGEYRGGIVEIASISGACRDALTPLVPEGGLCTQDYECVTGRCETGGIGDGLCERIPAEGEPCSFRCAAGLYCAGPAAMSVCASLQGEGATCAGGYQCASGRCDGADPRNGIEGMCASLEGYCDGDGTV
ncbi:MAG: hypothetical protein M3Y87_14770 [Myxococcota bacterium]|nr:hypothetical protein [Myxococcota bacterium]